MATISPSVYIIYRPPKQTDNQSSSDTVDPLCVTVAPRPARACPGLLAVGCPGRLGDRYYFTAHSKSTRKSAHKYTYRSETGIHESDLVYGKAFPLL